MTEIPFQTFRGFLKQHTRGTLSPLEQELFDTLFPLFDEDRSTKGTEALKSQIESFGLDGLLTVAEPEGRQRRFAGRNFPRSRYYSVASDPEGNDNQTLAHELRAYRNPIRLGMVEVIDLAGGCRFQGDVGQVELAPEHSIGVLIHNLDSLPQHLRRLQFRRLSVFKGRPLFLYRFPYAVGARTIERTIDLRRQPVRDWFYDTFKAPSDLIHWLTGPFVDSTIALSRFRLDNGRAPPPSNFWSMLPTLMNPDLGGGNPGSTGSTVLSIGHWMRQNNVAAFIYPSARCDVEIVISKGEMIAFSGWNLIDYGESPILAGRVQLTTMDPSPWAWVNFADGVPFARASKGVMRLNSIDEEQVEISSHDFISLHAASDPRLSGSFKVTGVVNYWAKDYIGRIEALGIARELHGDEGDDAKTSKALLARVFWIGILCVRWLRLLLDPRGRSEVTKRVQELQGLAQPLQIYEVTGRISELSASIDESTDVGQVILETLRIADRVGSAIAAKLDRPDVAKIVEISSTFELLLLLMTMLIKTRGASGAQGVSQSRVMCAKLAANLNDWFDPSTSASLRKYLEATPGIFAKEPAVVLEHLSMGQLHMDAAYKALSS